MRVLSTPVLLLGLATAGTPALAEGEAEGAPQEDPLGITWQHGPGSGQLGPIATVEIPEGFIFAGPEDTRRLMEAMQNPVSDTEMGFVAPQSMDWFVVFEFDEIGYVKDDDKAELDADAILESLREGQREGNELRAKRGWETLEIVGWLQAPHYDLETNNLEWSTKLRSSTGAENVNYNSRLLGRHGVMRATLVGSEQAVVQSMPQFKTILAGHRYESGKAYAEFREGDKIAKYGLTALITGGAAAVALKTGLLQKFWKLIVVGAVGGMAALKRLFRRSTPEQSQDGSASV